MSGAEGERLRRASLQEASSRLGALLKCIVCLVLIGLLVLIGAREHPDGAAAVATLGGSIAGALTTDAGSSLGDTPASPIAPLDPERRTR